MKIQLVLKHMYVKIHREKTNCDSNVHNVQENSAHHKNYERKLLVYTLYILVGSPFLVEIDARRNGTVRETCFEINDILIRKEFINIDGKQISEKNDRNAKKENDVDWKRTIISLAHIFLLFLCLFLLFPKQLIVRN